VQAFLDGCSKGPQSLNHHLFPSGSEIRRRACKRVLSIRTRGRGPRGCQCAGHTQRQGSKVVATRHLPGGLSPQLKRAAEPLTSNALWWMYDWRTRRKQRAPPFVRRRHSSGSGAVRALGAENAFSSDASDGARITRRTCINMIITARSQDIIRHRANGRSGAHATGTAVHQASLHERAQERKATQRACKRSVGCRGPAGLKQ